ncbi:unnamed protein product [Moneuplotes crassus]|uniref:Peptidase A1 domain-containing protein n=1 Tax=Euplotes crassus TaxID=5936 RepID=A0AAD1ULX4_EUPCR|nr:unnamed protein product [Moneuplotes crassus]
MLCCILISLAVLANANLTIELTRNEKDFLEFRRAKNNGVPLDPEHPKVIEIEDIKKFWLNRPSLCVGVTNSWMTEYTTTVKIGSNQQEMQVILGVGSRHLWVPKKKCIGCPTQNFFDSSNSSTFYNKYYEMNIYYEHGKVFGDLSLDEVRLGNPESHSFKTEIMIAREAQDLEGMVADGVLGIIPPKKGDGDSFSTYLIKNSIIDSKDITVFLGDGEDHSYAEFGSNKENTEEVTWVRSGIDYDFGITNNNVSFSYMNKTIPISTHCIAFDTESAVSGIPRIDLKTIISTLQQGKTLLYYEEYDFFGVKCASLDEFYDLQITFKEHISYIAVEDYILYIHGHCLFKFYDSGNENNVIILGNSFLRGTKFTKINAERKIGLWPQKLRHSPRIYEGYSYLWIYLLLIFLGISFAASGIYFYKRASHQKGDISEESEMAGGNEDRNFNFY